MKELFNVPALAAFIIGMCFTTVSCDNNGDNSDTPLKVALGQYTATPTSITIDVTTEGSLNGFRYAIGQLSDKSAFLNGTLTDMKTQNDLSLKTISFEDLASNTNYVVFAQPFSGETRGVLSMKNVQTTESPKTEWDLALTLAGNGTSETSTILRFQTIGADAEVIHYAIGQKEDLEKFKNGTMANIKKIYDMKTNQVTLSDLERGTEYVIFARAEGGGHVGEVAELSVRTLKLDFKVEIVEGSLTSTSAQFRVTPGGDVSRYKFYLGDKVEFQLFKSDSGSIMNIKWENDDMQPKIIKAEGIEPDTEYAFMAQAFAENGTRLDAIMVEFKTLAK